MDLVSDRGRWWHPVALAALVLIALIELWGVVSFGRMIHRASNMEYTKGVGFNTKGRRAKQRNIAYATRVYPSVIVGEMTPLTGPFQHSSFKLKMLASPSKVEIKILGDSLSGAIINMIVDAYIGRISDIQHDHVTGDVTATLVDMKIDDSSAHPSMFYPLQYPSSFQGTTNGTVVTTIFASV